jgi:hypothetical protein
MIQKLGPFFSPFFLNELTVLLGRNKGADVTLSNDLPDGLAGTVTFGMDSMVSKLGSSRFKNHRGIPG